MGRVCGGEEVNKLFGHKHGGVLWKSIRFILVSWVFLLIGIDPIAPRAYLICMDIKTPYHDIEDDDHDTEPLMECEVPG
jgi:hypothetical protein